MGDQEEKTRFRGVRRYLSWRANHYRDIGRGARAGFEAGTSGVHAFRLLRPAPKGSFSQEDYDGGYERFRQIVGDLGEDAIQRAIFKWDREAKIFILATAISLALIPSLFFFSDLGLMGIFCLLFLATVFGLLGVRASYRGWQVRQRRMGSLRHFLFGADRGVQEIRRIQND